MEQADLVRWVISGLQKPGKSKQGLAKAIRRSPQVVTEIIKGRRPIRFEEIESIAAYLELVRPDIIYFSGHAPPEITKGAPSTLAEYASRLPRSSPDVDTSEGVGPGGQWGGTPYDVRGDIVISDYILVEFTRAPAKRILWIRIRGDSMSGTLEPGDHACVDTSDTAIGQGGIFVIREADGELLVARLRKRLNQRGALEVEIVSDNAKQGNRVVSMDAINITGRVVARLTRVG